MVRVYGIRHHGPGSARSLVAALDDYAPDCVLVEGPADADPLLTWVGQPGLEPPVALLAYAPDEPRVAAFWPFAEFSPEWQALRWAQRHEAEAAWCDLPAALTLAPRSRTLLDAADETDNASAHADLDPPDDLERRRRLASRDPLGALADAGGHDDPERWWDDLVESRLDGSSPFPLIAEAMTELRQLVGVRRERHAEDEARREAYMRQRVRGALRRGRQRVAVVCGAWHAPALATPLGPAAPDAAILRGVPKRKVRCTRIPWTHQRLADGTGYGAGVVSPGWYHHLFTAPDRPVVRWFTAVAHQLRTRDLALSSAHVIEAVRLAETLAALRGRPLAGLSEVTDATRAVLCDGDELAVRFVTDTLVVGQWLGAVPAGVPTVPLAADLSATTRRLRLKRDATPATLDLDLRRPIDRQRSQLFHRLGLLELNWAAPGESEVSATGTFRETWRLCWEPELSLDVVSAAVWGPTVADAAEANVASVVAQQSLVELAATVGRCLLAGLPHALNRLLSACADRAALDTDVVHLMDALPALARATRYGDVRGTDTALLHHTCAVLVRRICAGLGPVAVGLDPDSAEQMRRRIDATHHAIGLLSRDPDVSAGTGGESPEPAPAGELMQRWLTTCRALADRSDLSPLLQGRLTRVLVDAALVDDAAVRLHRALSYGVEATAKAALIDGFFADGATLLVHDPALRGLLDAWVGGLGEEEFMDVLPLVRRTFGTFSVPQRRELAVRLVRGDPTGDADEPVDPLLLGPALARIEQILAAARG